MLLVHWQFGLQHYLMAKYNFRYCWMKIESKKLFKQELCPILKDILYSTFSFYINSLFYEREMFLGSCLLSKKFV
jgi:hypothetical protein